MSKQSTRSHNRRAEEFPPAESVLVTIHGAGKWEPAYAVPIEEFIESDVKKDVIVFPAWYGKLNPETKSRARGATATRFLFVHAAILAELMNDMRKRKSARDSRLQLDMLLPGGIDAITLAQHVAGYLLFPDFAKRLRTILQKQLDKAATTHKDIVLISHSLGSVVAFDLLKQTHKRYAIAHWYTVGCPLDKLVRIGERDGNVGHIRRNVKCWDNLYDKDDWVANQLKEFDFPIHNKAVDNAPDMPEAHNYFKYKQALTCYADAFRGDGRR
jgi:hypothetical protein